MLNLRLCETINGKLTSPSLLITPNAMTLTGCLIYITLSTRLQIALSSYSHTNILKCSLWSFRREDQAVQFVLSKFLSAWIASWCCFFSLTDQFLIIRSIKSRESETLVEMISRLHWAQCSIGTYSIKPEGDEIQGQPQRNLNWEHKDQRNTQLSLKQTTKSLLN